jgi:hypothetical protein
VSRGPVSLPAFLEFLARLAARTVVQSQTMNSGSLLQKASFVLLVAILGCLIYLIARDQPSRDHIAATQGNPELAAQVESTGALSTNAQKSVFAPLRPRVAPPASTVAARSTNGSRAAILPAMTATQDVAGVLPAAGSRSSPADAQPASFGFAGNAADASIVGRVKLRGTPPAEKRVALDPTCGRLHPKPMFTRHYVVGNDAGLANVLVYVKAGAPALTTKRSMPLLDQVACEYQPYVLGVQTGEVFAVRNSDSTLHNVHALPAINKERNIGQPVAGMISKISFDKPELFVRFKCDVHPWMFAYVSAIEHQWFAVTDKDGNFAIPSGLPAGRYTLAAVHQKAGELTQEITIPSSDNQPVNFTFEAPAPLASQ